MFRLRDLHPAVGGVGDKRGGWGDNIFIYEVIILPILYFFVLPEVHGPRRHPHRRRRLFLGLPLLAEFQGGPPAEFVVLAQSYTSLMPPKYVQLLEDAESDLDAAAYECEVLALRLRSNRDPRVLLALPAIAAAAADLVQRLEDLVVRVQPVASPGPGKHRGKAPPKLNGAPHFIDTDED